MVEAPLFGRVSGQLAAAREQARVAELKTGEAVQVGKGSVPCIVLRRLEGRADAMLERQS